MPRLLILVAATTTAVLGAASEPAPRTLTPVPLKIATPFAHITAARELPNGKILISDVSTPALVMLDPVSGAVTPIGTPGASPTQFTQPAGFYAGSGGTTILADHSGPRALVISPAGAITNGYPTGRHGVRSSSDSDTDDTKLDGRGFSYFADRANGSQTSGISQLIRLDPVKQTIDPIAKLMVPKQYQVGSGADGWTYWRSVIGDPADGWGVVADGRIAIVRAAPYRVEWVSPDGSSTLGPVVAYDPIPYTEADRQAAIKSGGRGAAVGAGTDTSTAAPEVERKFAAVKPPFAPTDVLVSPAGRVWVMRTQPFGAAQVIYDVFDTTGARVDRVQFPSQSKVIGFGPTAVFVREGAGKTAQLRKYKTP